ncbi:MAG TPA: thioredoxin domain-containing protein [Kofleriaceae bacterium]|nr:thioredoxin domain-containing protein [Kofleriaceae bacterium]
MKKLVLISAMFALAACQQDNKNLEKKIDDLTALVKAQGGRGAGAAQPQRPSRPEPDKAKTYAVPIEGDPFDGPADAKVTLVKAYDYACPYCEKVRETMDQLRQKYGNDLRVVYKQFVVHPQVATAGALAFCAAAKQGKGPQMDAFLWDKGFKAHNYDKDATAEGGAAAQKCWESAAGCPVVLGFAKELGLNENQFKTDMKDCQQLTQKDMRDLQQLGVGATPSFFINGRFMSGAMPMENFTALVDEELKKANEKIQSGTPAANYYNEWVINKGLKTLEAPKQ